MNLLYIIIIVILIKPEVLNLIKEYLKPTDRKETIKESEPDRTAKPKRKKESLKLSMFGDEQTLDVWAQRSDYSPNYLRQIYNKDGEDAVKKKIRNKLYNK